MILQVKCTNFGCFLWGSSWASLWGSSSVGFWLEQLCCDSHSRLHTYSTVHFEHCLISSVESQIQHSAIITQTKKKYNSIFFFLYEVNTSSEKRANCRNVKMCLGKLQT